MNYFSIFILFSLYIQFISSLLHGKSELIPAAELDLLVEIKSFYLKEDHDFYTEEDISFEFSKFETYLPRKNRPQGIYDGYDKLYGFSSPACSIQQWATVNKKSSLPSGYLTVYKKTWSLYQYSSYADKISYVDFKPPQLSFKAVAFERDSGEHDCEFDSYWDDNYHEQTFRIDLCTPRSTRCYSTIGQSSEPGWLYFPSTSKDYGFLIEPTLTLTGTRVAMTIDDGEIFEVYFRSSSSANAITPTPTSRSSYELKSVLLRSGGALAFRVSNNILQTSLLVNTMTISTGAELVFDIKNFQQSTDNTTETVTFDFKDVIRATTRLTGSTAPSVRVVNIPTNFTLEAPLATVDTVNKTVAVSFKIAPTVFTEPPTPAPITEPPVQCAANCNGHGACTAAAICECFDDWVSDPTSGCIDGADITQTTQTAQVIVFGTVSGTATEGTDVPLVKVSQTRNEIPATMSTLNDEITTSLMSKNVPQISSPSFIQQYGIIIGAAGGGVLLLAIIGIIVCVCVAKRKKKNYSNLNAVEKDDVVMSTYAGVNYPSSQTTNSEPVEASGEYGNLNRVQNKPAFDLAGGEEAGGEYAVPDLTTSGTIDGDMYTVPDLSPAEAVTYSELTLQQNNDNSDSEDIANRGYAGKKTTQFEPSEAPALTYAEFDPDSARFEKYHD